MIRPGTITSHLNLNGLLVSCQIDKASPVVAPGVELDPGAHMPEMRTWTQSSAISAQEVIGEVIPVPVSQWKETTFVSFIAS